MKHILACAFFTVLATSSNAITIDIARSPADAIVPNVSSEAFSGIGVVGGGCTGSAIASNLVLTAAHCFSSSNQSTNFFIPFDDQPDVLIGGTARLFPGYNPTVDPFNQKNIPDLAVVELVSSLPSFVPTYGLASFVAAPVGSLISMAGFGRTGNGNTGAIPGSNSQFVRRAGNNVVDQVQSNGNFFDADFDGGGFNRLGGGSVGVTESATARGDSGGPAFYNPAAVAAYALQNSDLPPGTTIKLTPSIDYILGVTSYGTAFGGANLSSYGSTSSWAFVAPHVDWISGFSSEVSSASLPTIVSNPNNPILLANGLDWVPPPNPDLSQVPLPSGLLIILSSLFPFIFVARKRAKSQTC
jgi:hypothetical protein